MAYGAAIRYRDRIVAGRRMLIMRVVETEARDTSKWSTVPSASVSIIDDDTGLAGRIYLDAYQNGLLTIVSSVLESGSGGTIQTEFGQVVDWVINTDNHIWKAPAATLLIDERPALALNLFRNTPGGDLVGQDFVLHSRSNVNSATPDNTIRHLITLQEGHHP